MKLTLDLPYRPFRRGQQAQDGATAGFGDGFKYGLHGLICLLTHIRVKAYLTARRELARPQGPLRVCAVTRRRFSSGCKAHPPGDSLQPEATGAGMEVTKCLKPPV